MTHASPENPVEFNQSDDHFKTPEVISILCSLCIRRSAVCSHDVWGRDYKQPVTSYILVPSYSIGQNDTDHHAN